MMPVTVSGVDMPASRRVNRSRPPVACSTDIRTVTPQTIMITRHGMMLTASSSSPARSSESSTAPPNAPSPTCTSKNTTLVTSVPMTANVISCERLKPSPA